MDDFISVQHRYPVTLGEWEFIGRCTMTLTNLYSNFVHHLMHYMHVLVNFVSCMLTGNVGDGYSKFYCSSDVLVVRPLLHIAMLVSHQELSLRFVWAGRHYHYNECLNVFGR